MELAHGNGSISNTYRNNVGVSYGNHVFKSERKRPLKKLFTNDELSGIINLLDSIKKKDQENINTLT